MKHLKKFNEEVRHDYEQEEGRIFSDVMDITAHFIRNNYENIVEIIELWETSKGRDFDDDDFFDFYKNYCSLEGEYED